MVRLNRGGRPEPDLGPGAPVCDIGQSPAGVAPADPSIYLQLSARCFAQGDLPAALDFGLRELSRHPANADAHYNVGLVLHRLQRWAPAIDHYQRALALRPDYLDALLNQGLALQSLGQPRDSTTLFEQAVRLAPNHPEAHWLLATALLQVGDWKRGWAEFEWRWRQKGFTTPFRAFSQPRWKGQDLTDRTLFLHAEQGAGDAIQFYRYVPHVAALGARVVLGCSSSLAGLFHGQAGLTRVVTTPRDALPFDYHCPLMSLPHVLSPRLIDVPSAIPYLVADRPSGLIPTPSRPSKLKVGLAWAGGSSDPQRNVPVEWLSSLVEFSDAAFYSLQVGPAAADAARLGDQLVDCTDRLRHFGDTAAVISQLDLVITVDTAVAHLAGALGRPVWVLLRHAADWRWMIGRDDSLWYPTMRLIRQKKPGDWGPVVRQATAWLELALANRTSLR